MKIIYYTLLWIVIGIQGNLNAQVIFDLCDLTLFSKIDAGKQEHLAIGNISNNSSEKLDVIFKIEDWLIPKDWEVFIQCKQFNRRVYPSKNENPITLVAGEKAEIKISIQTNGNEGEGLLSIKVFEKNNRLDAQIGTFIFGRSDPYQPTNAVQISLYPNPVSDQFIVISNRKIKKIEVYNILGTLQRTFLASSISTYNISDLPKGVYLLKFLTPDNTIVKTTRLQKQ